MRATIFLSLLAFILASVGSVQVELSSELLRDIMKSEAYYLDAMFQEHWRFERAKRPNIMRVTIDIESLKTVKNTHSNTAAIELNGEVTRHSADHDKFILAVQLSLRAAPSYSAFKQIVESKVEIRTLGKNRPEDYRIMTEFYQNISDNILDWTHLHLDQAGEQFISEHFALLCAVKSADSISSDEHGIYLDYTPIKFIERIPLLAPSNPLGNKYLGFHQFSGAFFENMLSHQIFQRQDIFLSSALGLVGLSLPQLEHIGLFIPEITEMKDKSSAIYDVKLMPDREEFKYYSVMNKDLKVDFQKDNIIDVNLPVPFDLGLIIQDGISKKYKFDTLREGYMIFHFKINLEKIKEDNNKIAAEVSADIKAVKIYTLDGKEMTEESKAIFDFIQSRIERIGGGFNKTFDLQAYLNLLPCFGFQNSFDFDIRSDSLSIGFNKSESIPTSGCPKFPNKDTILNYSKAFQRVENKREMKATGKDYKGKGRPEMIEGFGGFKIKVDF